jgi:hypothetical protein
MGGVVVPPPHAPAALPERIWQCSNTLEDASGAQAAQRRSDGWESRGRSRGRRKGSGTPDFDHGFMAPWHHLAMAPVDETAPGAETCAPWDRMPPYLHTA